MQPLLLPPNEIHLWLSYYDRVDSEGLCAAYRRLLNDAEKAQELRFYFAQDRLCYLVTRALTRTVLSRYADVAPAAWFFSTNAFGRPEIANTERSASGLAFNLSHTHNLIVLAVTRDRAIGVDVENIADRNAPVELAERFFAPEEVADLESLPDQRRPNRFYEYWTFKESYIKARGMGLALPLDSFAFRFPNEHAVNISVRGECDGFSPRWLFWQFQPSAEYLVAVCGAHTESTRFVVREALPLVAETLIQPTLLRSSDQSDSGSAI